MPKNYPLFYALREMKSRPRTFLPLFAIFFGVMLLMGNLLVYSQCNITTDITYYKVETQLILPKITETEVEVLRNLPYVTQVEAVPDEGGYICYVALDEASNRNSTAILQKLIDVIEDLQLEGRDTRYDGFMNHYRNHGFRRLPTYLTNSTYLDVLDETSFNPVNLLLIVVSALMMLAVTVLVFRMKISQSRKEYAVLAGLGLSVRGLGSIQRIQGAILIALGFIPSQVLAILTMKLVSLLSFRIAPGFDGNTALLFDVPWGMLAASFFADLAAVMLGLHLCMRTYRTRTVSAILAGNGEKIPFVPQSSVKFLSRGSFDGYSKVWRRRKRAEVVPIMVLFLLLILFPALLFGVCVSEFDDILDDLSAAETEQRICSVVSSHDNGIPYSLLRELEEIPGVSRVSVQGLIFSVRIEGAVGSTSVYETRNTAAAGDTAVSIHPMMATYLMEERPADGTIWVPTDFPFDEGDTITLTSGSQSIQATIGRKTPLMPTHTSKFNETTYAILYPESLYTALFGDSKITFDTDIVLWSSLPDSEIETLLDVVAASMGETRVFLNDHDRLIHLRNEREYYLQDAYYTNLSNRIWNTFTTLFFVVQAVYLLSCAAVVISGTIDFQLHRRRGEFAVLRALGLPDEGIRSLCAVYSGNFFRWVTPVLYPILVLLACYMDPGIRFETDLYGNTTFQGTATVLLYAGTYLVTCGILYLLYSTVTHLSARKAAIRLLSQPLAEAVKERE